MNTDKTYEALSGLRAALPDLDEALVPGTRRRWTQRDLTDEQRAHLDRLAREERAAKEETLRRGLVVLGDSRAPLDLTVLDAALDIAAAVAELEDAVCDRLGLTPLARASTCDRINRLIGLLDRVAAIPDLGDHVHSEAVRLHGMARRALGDTEPIHRLNARCPICGAKSLRAFPERQIVACVNTACRCAEAECECHADRPGRHRWVFAEWPELADQLAEVEA